MCKSLNSSMRSDSRTVGNLACVVPVEKLGLGR